MTYVQVPISTQVPISYDVRAGTYSFNLSINIHQDGIYEILKTQLTNISSHFSHSRLSLSCKPFSLSLSLSLSPTHTQRGGLFLLFHRFQRHGDEIGSERLNKSFPKSYINTLARLSSRLPNYRSTIDCIRLTSQLGNIYIQCDQMWE